jgi:LAO/AO transport system kinase
MTGAEAEEPALVRDLLDGDHRALARVITKIENREPGYRDIVSRLYAHTGSADVIGITGSPGAGKSTLVDKMAKAYRDQGLTVGVIAVDPSSPYTGGAVLGDRIRMASNVGDMDVFFRSMSTRGSLGGLSTATTDAVKALDAFGKDKVLIETVGAGQNEVDVVRAADTVAVLVPPSSGDDVQMLKAGILEIADVFVVNKADLSGADRTVKELSSMLEMRGDDGGRGHDQPDHHAGHHAPDAGHDAPEPTDESDDEADDWTPRIVETVADSGEGVAEFLDVLDDHRTYLAESGALAEHERTRTAEEIRTLLREDVNRLVERDLDRRGGIDALVDAALAGDTNPYEIADEVREPLADCLDERDD